MKSISVFGIGKLGFPLVACLGSKGYKVIGYDINPQTVRAVNERKPSIYEPGLAEMLQKAGDISAADDVGYVIDNTEATFIVVPTPSQPDGSFTTRYVEEAAEKIARALKNKDSYHLVILTSTVLPGDTEIRILPVLERGSGKKCGRDFGLCYSPEFIALGSVIRDFLNPDTILIGEYDQRSGDLLAEIYRQVCENNPPIVRTNISSAELAKISLNSYVTMKISFANALAELCERIPGGDASAVTRLLGNDTRIGSKYLAGGLAYGGPCFPRDNKAFAWVARKHGCEARLSIATDKENEHQNERIVALIEKNLQDIKGKNIAMLGLSYKANSEVVEESAALKIASELLKKGASLSVYDPAAMNNTRKALGEKGVRYAGSAKECLKDADFCILATPWKEFKALKPEDFTANMRQPALLDCWSFFDRAEFAGKMRYLTIGLNQGA